MKIVIAMVSFLFVITPFNVFALTGIGDIKCDNEAGAITTKQFGNMSRTTSRGGHVVSFNVGIDGYPLETAVQQLIIVSSKLKNGEYGQWDAIPMTKIFNWVGDQYGIEEQKRFGKGGAIKYIPEFYDDWAPRLQSINIKLYERCEWKPVHGNSNDFTPKGKLLQDLTVHCRN
jgi:hypothetical protein